jgi:hypothetical protein
MIIYAGNIVFLGLMNFLLWKHISNPSNHLTEGLSGEERKLFSIRAVVVPLVFILTAVVYIIVDPRIAVWVPPFIPLIMRMLTRRFKKTNVFTQQ